MADSPGRTAAVGKLSKEHMEKQFKRRKIGDYNTNEGIEAAMDVKEWTVQDVDDEKRRGETKRTTNFLHLAGTASMTTVSQPSSRSIRGTLGDSMQCGSDKPNDFLLAPEEADNNDEWFKEQTAMAARWTKVMCQELGTPDRYVQVAVLNVLWDDHLNIDLNCHAEVQELHDLFSKQFNYASTILKLTDVKRPQIQLNHAVTDFVYKYDGPSRSNLLIVFYSGHGGIKGDEGLELMGCAPIYPDQLKQRYDATANWNVAERALIGAEADVLLIFDCCFAGTIFKSGNEDGRNFEVLAATGLNKPTAGPGPESFSRALIDSFQEILNRSDGKPFTTFDLNGAIMKKRRDMSSHVLPRYSSRARPFIRLAPVIESPSESMTLTYGSHVGKPMSLDLKVVFKPHYHVKLGSDDIDRLATGMSRSAAQSELPIAAIEWLHFVPGRALDFTTLVARCIYAKRVIRRWRSKTEFIDLGRSFPPRPPVRNTVQRSAWDSCQPLIAWIWCRRWRWITSLRKRKRSTQFLTWKIHACEICNTSYTEKRSLVRHLRTTAHLKRTGTSAPTYRCDICTKTFSRDDIRKRHEREQHRKIKRPPSGPIAQYAGPAATHQTLNLMSDPFKDQGCRNQSSIESHEKSGVTQQSNYDTEYVLDDLGDSTKKTRVVSKESKLSPQQSSANIGWEPMPLTKGFQFNHDRSLSPVTVQDNFVFDSFLSGDVDEKVHAEQVLEVTKAAIRHQEASASVKANGSRAVLDESAGIGFRQQDLLPVRGSRSLRRQSSPQIIAETLVPTPSPRKGSMQRTQSLPARHHPPVYEGEAKGDLHLADAQHCMEPPCFHAAVSGESSGGNSKRKSGSQPSKRDGKRQRIDGNDESAGRNGDGDADRNDNRDDGDARPPRGRKPTKFDLINGRTWACYYFKRCPEMFNSSTDKRFRLCAARGWACSRDLDQHIERDHMSPACMPCGGVYDDRDTHLLHLLQHQECMDNPLRFAGFTDMPTLDAIKQSVRSSQDGEERWRQVFKHLYRNWVGEIPSPFFDHSHLTLQNPASPNTPQLHSQPPRGAPDNPAASASASDNFRKVHSDRCTEPASSSQFEQVFSQFMEEQRRINEENRRSNEESTHFRETMMSLANQLPMHTGQVVKGIGVQNHPSASQQGVIASATYTNLGTQTYSLMNALGVLNDEVGMRPTPVNPQPISHSLSSQEIQPPQNNAERQPSSGDFLRYQTADSVVHSMPDHTLQAEASNQGPSTRPAAGGCAQQSESYQEAAPPTGQNGLLATNVALRQVEYMGQSSPGVTIGNRYSQSAFDGWMHFGEGSDALDDFNLSGDFGDSGA